MKFIYRVNIRNQCYFLKNLYKNFMIDLFLQQKNESSGPSTSGRRRSQHERVRRTANRQEGEQHVRLSSNDDSAGQNSGTIAKKESNTSDYHRMMTVPDRILV